MAMTGYRITDCLLQDSVASRAQGRGAEEEIPNILKTIPKYGWSPMEREYRSGPLTQPATIKMGLCDDRGHD